MFSLLWGLNSWNGSQPTLPCPKNLNNIWAYMIQTSLNLDQWIQQPALQPFAVAEHSSHVLPIKKHFTVMGWAHTKSCGWLLEWKILGRRVLGCICRPFSEFLKDRTSLAYCIVCSSSTSILSSSQSQYWLSDKRKALHLPVSFLLPHLIPTTMQSGTTYIMAL